MVPLLSCQLLSKSFSARALFQNISLGLGQGERLGLIGPNGSGKSTLLRILAGEETPDSGEVSRRRDLRLVYLPQEDCFPPEQTVGEALNATIQAQNLEDYERAALLNVVLGQVGFTQTEQRVGTLSGGWRKRLALAHALLQRPELLLLDEPTNHLDLEGVLWLEGLLKKAPFAVLLISHDRYFLENLVHRMVELNRAYPEGYLSSEGTYSDFLTKKQEFLDAQAHQQHALTGQVKREVEWLRRGPQARTTKAKARIEQAGQMIGELAELKYRNTQDRTAEIDFTATRRKTNDLLVVKEIEKSLGGKRLFSHLNFTLSPGTRLGLLGPNGSGKTTLLRLLTGELEPDSGTIRRADRLRIVNFEQDRSQLERQVPLRRALSPEGDNVSYRDSSMHISAWAKRFLFRTEQLDMPVANLSGGEQARVLIANLMRQPADLLILDEPTNDLDIPTLEVLEESLLDFPGAIVLVTHDRYLLDNVSTEILALDGKGHFAHLADYAQWESLYAGGAGGETKEKGKGKREEGRGKTDNDSIENQKSKNETPRRLSTAEMRELNNMEATIMTAEAEVERLQARLTEPEVVADHREMQMCWEAIQAAQGRVAQLYARWEELEARRNR